MSRKDDAGETFDSVGRRYERWEEANPRPHSSTALKIPVLSDAAEKVVGMAVGFGVGGLLLVLAAVAATAARSWAEIERSGAVVGYSVTAFFLTLAGLGAIVATWNHVFRVIPGEASHH